MSIEPFIDRLAIREKAARGWLVTGRAPSDFFLDESEQSTIDVDERTHQATPSF
jgi:hypothetical protein